MRSAPVAWLRTVTLAFGTTAPCGSVTVPWSVAVDCARAVAQRARHSAAANDRAENLKTFFLSLICISLESPDMSERGVSARTGEMARGRLTHGSPRQWRSRLQAGRVSRVGR